MYPCIAHSKDIGLLRKFYIKIVVASLKWAYYLAKSFLKLAYRRLSVRVIRAYTKRIHILYRYRTLTLQKIFILQDIPCKIYQAYLDRKALWNFCSATFRMERFWRLVRGGEIYQKSSFFTMLRRNPEYLYRIQDTGSKFFHPGSHVRCQKKQPGSRFPESAIEK